MTFSNLKKKRDTYQYQVVYKHSKNYMKLMKGIFTSSEQIHNVLTNIQFNTTT